MKTLRKFPKNAGIKSLRIWTYPTLEPKLMSLIKLKIINPRDWYFEKLNLVLEPTSFYFLEYFLVPKSLCYKKH